MLKPNDKEREYWKVKVINSPEDNPRNIRIRKIMKGNNLEVLGDVIDSWVLVYGCGINDELCECLR